METSSERLAKHVQGSRLLAVAASTAVIAADSKAEHAEATFAAMAAAAGLPATAIGHVDHVYDAAMSDAELLASDAKDAWMESGTLMRVIGWALDERYEPLQAVALVIGDALMVCEYGLSRPDLIQAFNTESAGRSGFRILVDTANFAPGNYEARVVGLDFAGRFVEIPNRIGFHFAVVRPLADFYQWPPSTSLRLTLDACDSTYAVAGTDICVSGRASDSVTRAPLEDIAAIVDSGDLIRGRRTRGAAGDVFRITIPTSGRSPGALTARIVAIGPSGRAERPMPARQILQVPPTALLGMRPLCSRALIRARTRPARTENGRIDVQSLVVEGLAIDRTSRQALRGIAFRVRRTGGDAYPGGQIFWGAYGIRRETADNDWESMLRDTGFRVTIDRADFEPGEYIVEALAVPLGMRGYLVPEQVTSFTVSDTRASRSPVKRAKVFKLKSES